MLHALTASGRRVVQLVCGPGCDGESPVAAMQAAVRAADEGGRLLGVLPIADDLVPEMARMASALSSSRTPNILARAAARAQAPASGDAPLCTIERHGSRAEIPWSWLTVALAIKCGST